MTCLEKLKEMHPHWTAEDIRRTSIRDCPHSYGIMGDPIWCLEEDGNDRCKRCWEREVLEEKSAYEICQEIMNNPDAKKVTVEFPDNDNSEPRIKDSGDRTQFESGAVRDMREGKGRFDLAPLEVMAIVLGTNQQVMDPIVYNISTFMKTNDTSRLRIALRNFAEKAYDDSIPSMFLDVAKHYEAGAKKYGPDNWRKSIPTWCYVDSGVRHYMKWLRGDNDEPHAAALVWNLLCCIWEVDWGEEWRANHKKEDEE